MRPALQLRADLGPPRRLHLVGALRGRASCSTRSTTTSPTRPRRRRHRLVRGRPQGDGPLRDVGPARRDRARSAAPRAAAAPTTRRRLRLEDLLGFRRNPTTATPLFRRFGAKALDGHPTPATPFVRLSTGASGVGLASSIGLAFGARDYYGADCPARAHRRGRGRAHAGPRGRGAGGGRHGLARQRRRAPRLEPGLDRQRQRLPRGRAPGDYVQWDPRRAVLPARLERRSRWPTATTSSRWSPPSGGRWRSTTASRRRSSTARARAGSTASRARRSHGAGHKLCSEGFYEALAELTDGASAASCRPAGPDDPRCAGRRGDAVREECFWEALEVVRRRSRREPPGREALARPAGGGSRAARRARPPAARRRAARRRPSTSWRPQAPRAIPDELRLAAGRPTTLRGELGRACTPQQGLRRRPARRRRPTCSARPA